MAKASWNGVLSLGLINVPVGAISVAESAESISFNQLHKVCNSRIKQKKHCPKCDIDVTDADIVKGYEFTKGQYVVVSADDIARAKVESDRQIKLTAFVDDDLDPLLIDKSYYLVPERKAPAGPYFVLQKALGIKMAIGTVAMYGREYQCAIQTRGNGFVMHTLHTARDVRNIDNMEPLQDVPVVSEQEIELARMLIDRMDDEIDLAAFEDRYRKTLREVIDAKLEGREPEVPATVPEPQATTSMLDALKASLAAVGDVKKKTAKADLSAAAPLARAAMKSRKKSA